MLSLLSVCTIAFPFSYQVNVNPNQWPQLMVNMQGWVQGAGGKVLTCTFSSKFYLYTLCTSNSMKTSSNQVDVLRITVAMAGEFWRLQFLRISRFFAIPKNCILKIFKAVKLGIGKSAEHWRLPLISYVHLPIWHMVHGQPHCPPLTTAMA